MQRVVGRTVAAKRQAARRLTKEEWQKFKDERRSERNMGKYLLSSKLQTCKEGRRRRMEDWKLGPLAPRRDVGEAAETYGTTDMLVMDYPTVPERNRIKHWLIQEGDRGVVVKGRDKGKIGKIISIDKESETVKIQGVNMVEVHTPKWMRKEYSENQSTRVIPGPISVKNIRLVHAYLDPETHTQRDVIANEVSMCAFWRDPITKEVTYGREIKGLPSSEPEYDDRPSWERIPWPDSKEDEPEEKDHDADTLRITVDEKTFVPTLLRPPMPPSVLDELRNRYSKFRDRHDPEYIAAKEAEDVDADARTHMPEWMLQPSRELRDRAKNKEKLIKPAVPDLLSEEDFLARIGQIMSERTVSQEALQEKA